LTLPGPVLLDLVAAVLQAGAPVTTALRVVGQAAASQGDEQAGRELLRLAERHDLALDGVDGSSPSWVAALDEVLLLARESGVAVAPVLSAAASEERRRQAADARAAAARLGVRVVLPTGLCLLPAFVLLAIVPLVLALLGVG
jgi:pilus assembly protein TadC